MALFSSHNLAAKTLIKWLAQPLTGPLRSSNVLRHSSHFHFIPESPDPSFGKISKILLLYIYSTLVMLGPSSNMSVKSVSKVILSILVIQYSLVHC